MPSLPWAISTRKAMMIAVITAVPAMAVAWRSIFAKRSSRPSPRRPRMVSLRPPRRRARPNSARMPNETAPPPGSPPIACAAKIRPPRKTLNSGRNHLDRSGLRRSVGTEDLLHWGLEEGGYRERQGQRGRVALGLDRVDRLTRDAEGLAEVGLGEAVLAAQLPDVVSHRL